MRASSSPYIWGGAKSDVSEDWVMPRSMGYAVAIGL